MYGAAYWNGVWSRPYGRYNRHHADVWSAVLPFIKGKVVDLACGTCLLYKDKNIDLTGIDFSSQAIKEAQKNFPNGKYIVADISCTGLPKETFDTAVLFGVLDYYDDWFPLIKEASRILKKNGRILATLLYGFNGHMWTEGLAKSKTSVVSFRHLTSNWFLIECARLPEEQTARK